MEARERLRLLLLLLLLIAFAGAVVIRGALLSQTFNVTTDEESCNLQVRWLPAEPPNSNCTRTYIVAVRINGNWDKADCIENTYWNKNVPLGEKIDFGIKTSCQEYCEGAPAWNDDDAAFHVDQNWIAGTEAREVNCTWWERKYMECEWRAGEKASPDTSYRLSFWHDGVKKEHQCRNVTREGLVFRCGFTWNIGHVEFIVISIQGNSENIQPFCLVSRSINSLVKCHPPVITNFSNNGGQVFLQWEKPNLSTLHYQIEVNSEPEYRNFTNTDRATISVKPNARHTFRVRVKSEAGKEWSDWSKMKVLDGTASRFPLLLFILIPLCVTLLLVILLIYLKRIKLLILPKIPDPGEILKHMLEEPNENQPTHETASNEETHSLMIVEPAGNEK